MRIEDFIGRGISECRTRRGITQAELGEKLARYSGKAWSRQAVSSAEAGKRSFTAADLLALSLALDMPIPFLICSLSFPLDDASTVLELPTGEKLPSSELLGACFGSPNDNEGKPLIAKLIDAWSDAQTHATSMQFLIRSLISDEGASEIFGDYLEPEEEGSEGGEEAADS